MRKEWRDGKPNHEGWCHMKGKTGNRALLWRGLAGLSAFLLAFASFGTVCARSYEAKINSFLGVSSTKVVSGESSTDTNYYSSAYGDFTEENLLKLEADVYDHIIEEEEEGAVLLKNDNQALPLASGSKISLFGLASYYPLYHTASAGSRTYKNDELTTDYYEALTDQGSDQPVIRIGIDV
jgi:beta-glucosidase